MNVRAVLYFTPGRGEAVLGIVFLFAVRYFDVSPIADVTLTVVIISDCNHSAVGLQTYGIGITGNNCYDICPVVYITLPKEIASSRHHGAVGF